MNRDGIFKKPTIKSTSRAYVKLFGYFAAGAEWLAFLNRYRVEYVAFGMQRDGDCAVRVIDPSTREIAILGLEIPNEIKFHNHVPTGRSFWTEHFISTTHQRNMRTEVGYAQASEDNIFPR